MCLGQSRPCQPSPWLLLFSHIDASRQCLLRCKGGEEITENAKLCVGTPVLGVFLLRFPIAGIMSDEAGFGRC